MKLKTTKVLALFAGLAITPCGATVIIAHSFSGSGATSLNGVTADTFSSAITSAGGSAAWSAGGGYQANGSLTGSNSALAAFAVGSYINDFKGQANGIFRLTATISQVTTAGSPPADRWLSVNFISPVPTLSYAPNTQLFVSPNRGVGIALRRAASGTTYFNQTPGGTGAVTMDWPATADVTFTVELDLSAWNGTSNFGTLRFFRDGSTTASHTTAVPSDFDFTHVGISRNLGANGTFDNFSLVQIPEPGSLMLAAVSCLALARRRRLA